VDEPIAMGSTEARVANPDALDLSMTGEELAKRLLGRVVRKVAHIEFHFPAFEGTLTEDSMERVGFAR
jgi:hypothetical protein